MWTTCSSEPEHLRTCGAVAVHRAYRAFLGAKSMCLATSLLRIQELADLCVFLGILLGMPSQSAINGSSKRGSL